MKKLPKHLHVLLFFFLSPALLIFSPAAEARVKKYSLEGTVGVAYSSRWFTEGDAETELLHYYRLGLKSYIKDPRFIRYDVEGLFSQRISNQVENITATGIAVNVNFFEGAPNRSIGLLSYIPKPIRTRFSYYTSGEQTAVNYGISLAYTRPERFRLFYNGKIIYLIDPRTEAMNQQNLQNNMNNNQNNMNNNGNNFNNNLNNLNNQGNNLNNAGAASRAIARRGLPFPEFFLDYDRSQFKSNGDQSTFSVLDFRSQLLLDKYSYFFQYRHESREEQNFASKNNVININADYNHFDIKTRRSLVSYNRFSYSFGDSQSEIFFSDNTAWASPVGTNNFDKVHIGGGVGYVKTDLTAYNAYVNPVYLKRLSPVLTDRIGVSVTYGGGDDNKRHSQRLMNVLEYDASRFFRLSNTVYIGQSTDGAEYGANIGVTSKTRIYFYAGYGFSVGNSPEGRLVNHLFSFRAAGPIIDRLTFSADATYELADVPGLDTVSSQDTLRAYGNLYYPFGKSNLVIGANFQDSKTRAGNGLSSQARTMSLTVSYFRVISSRVLLSVYGAWVNSEPGGQSVQFSPRLSIAYRQVNVNMEYEFSKQLDSDQAVHRVYLNVSRQFGMRF